LVGETNWANHIRENLEPLGGMSEINRQSYYDDYRVLFLKSQKLQLLAAIFWPIAERLICATGGCTNPMPNAGQPGMKAADLEEIDAVFTRKGR
jgi:hypothetical protein